MSDFESKDQKKRFVVKNPFLWAFVAIGAALIVFVSWPYLERFFRKPDYSELSSIVADEESSSMPLTVVDEDTSSELEPSSDSQEYATAPVPIEGEAQTVQGNGVLVSFQPANLVLTIDQPFGIKFTIEIQDSIDPNIEEIRFPNFSEDIEESTDVSSSDPFDESHEWNSASDAVNVEYDFDEYVVTGFKPGDTIEFCMYGTCPDMADWHEAETVGNHVYGYYAPETNQYGVLIYGDEIPLVDFDYFVTIQNENGETSGDALRRGEAAEKGISVEDYDAETRQEINQALDAARAQTTDVKERADLFTDAVMGMHLTVIFDGLDGDILKMETYNGYVLDINLAPEYDSEPVFDY